MKKTLVLFAHPYLEHSNSNREIINFYERRQNYTFRDLYEDYPDFHIAAFRERKRLLDYDRLIFHFPLIWFGLPPLLKLWIDEVFDLQWIKESSKKPLMGKEAYILTTVGGKENEFSRNGLYGFSIKEFLSPLITTLQINGITLKHIMAVYEAEVLTKKEMIGYKQKFLNLLEE